MIRDWRPLVVEMIHLQQALSDADKERLWEYHLPRVAASEVTLARVERHLGFKLEPEYRSFLATADGWPWFSQSVSLFGSSELLGGSALVSAHSMLDAAEPYIESRCGFQRNCVFPIAASLRDRDIFFMQTTAGNLLPPIVWLAGEEVDRYVSFSEFFASMIEYSKLDLKAMSTIAPLPGSNRSRTD